MNLKEDFLKINTYEEYDKRRAEFKDLDMNDSEVKEHWRRLFPTIGGLGDEDGIITEVYSEISKGGKRRWI